MRKVWTIKLYESPMARVPFKVAVEGYMPGCYGERVHAATGRGETPEDAWVDAHKKLPVVTWLKP